MQIEDSLKSSYNLLMGVYPEGIPSEDYFAVLDFLYEEFSDRNLAKLISIVCNMDSAVVLNDIYKSQSEKKPTKEILELIKNKFIPYGYEEWKMK